ncbi:cora-domain-containing protein [Wilcoxina mikolae CBS 423.85]|nr:cora-domain-containing protein [Wilcoxina mikolae CBS 423.85]
MSAQRSASVSSTSSSVSLSPTEHTASRHGDAGQTSHQQPNYSRTQSAPMSRHTHHRSSNRRSNSTSMNNGDTFNGPQLSGLGGRPGTGFYLQPNLSGVSMDSTALLDHREQVSMRPRRSSTTVGPSFDVTRTPSRHHQYHYRQHDGNRSDDDQSSGGEDGETVPLVRTERLDERTALLGRHRTSRPGTSGSRRAPPHSIETTRLAPPMSGLREYGGVNFPPSVPTSPHLEPAHLDGDLHGLNLSGSRGTGADGDTIINIGPDTTDSCSYMSPSSPSSSRSQSGHAMRSSTLRAEEDVCFPVDDGLMDEEVAMHECQSGRTRTRRQWPEMTVLEEWSREEKEERSEGIRAKKLAEPVYVSGRLRPPVTPQWHRDEEESPYRFTYFNEELPATIHSHTISELLQPGQTFTDLFRPEPRVIDDSSDDEVEPPPIPAVRTESSGEPRDSRDDSRNDITPPEPSQSLPRLGPRPTFWLDVFRPTDAEMKVISKAFGIHPLTTEDIMMQEAREKVELFRSYYLVSYRTFEQDSNNEDYMDPVNIYVVVFRDGVISFHFSMTPHPANVRRRIRQLKDYITVSADWISYALIDDITDAFQPLIQSLEKEVDDIDDAILRMHLDPDAFASKSIAGSANSENEEEQKSDGEMLKRVGDSRRSVMSLYRLMGNKADVIKGFAKRCNEQWQVAPRSEIGLYLGDIQDHIVTMVSNLNHMEKILSRSHSNYLAQINIKMNERQEQTADVLGRLTVLGTIVLPMNIITGLWGMNVMVPGQEIANLDWFWCITAGLIVFGFLCYYIAKRVYKIM